MNKEIIYGELIRQYQEGNNADNIVNKKIDFLLVLPMIFTGYFFNTDSFISVFREGNILIRYLFGAGILCLSVSLYFNLKAFLLMKFKMGIKIDKLEKIIKKHKEIKEYDVLNFSLKEAIRYNYKKQKIKNKHFFNGFVFLFVSVFLLTLSIIIFKF